jgi:aspartate kinase
LSILVMKFGGTSLAAADARSRVADHIARERRCGHDVVVVVSAMGRLGDPYATDTLIEWINEQGGKLPQREMDLLLSCGELISAATLCSTLLARDIPSAVLTGGQAGIETDDQYGQARIVHVRPNRILELLQQGKVVIVTGFQGQTASGETTTLGRGGSDTTATALGYALHADWVDIYTDVDGILTADPKYVQDAKRLPVISYGEICNLAYHGAKVIHPRAVEIAMQAQIPLRVRSTFSDDEGTIVIGPENPLYQRTAEVVDRHVTGIAYVERITQIRVDALDGQYDLQRNLFKSLAQQQISIDFINLNPSGAVFTVFDHEAEQAADVLRSAGFAPSVLPGCAKVAVIGGGMNGVPGIMARIVDALTMEDVDILQSADSNTTIWVLVPGRDLVKSLRALHRTFELHR